MADTDQAANRLAAGVVSRIGEGKIMVSPPRGGHGRRPPLAEIDTWELWQVWKRGERRAVLPWLGLLGAFCMVLAAMYSFFVFSAVNSDDPFGLAVITLVFLVLFIIIGRRISPRRGFALAVVGLMVAVSLAAFLLWLLVYGLTGWNPGVAVLGTLILGLSGIVIGLPSLNAIAKREGGA